MASAIRWATSGRSASTASGTCWVRIVKSTTSAEVSRRSVWRSLRSHRPVGRLDVARRGRDRGGSRSGRRGCSSCGATPGGSGRSRWRNVSTLAGQLVGVVGDGAVHLRHRPAELVGEPPVRREAQRRGVEVRRAVAQDHEAEVLLHEPSGGVERVEVGGHGGLAGGLEDELEHLERTPRRPRGCRGRRTPRRAAPRGARPCARGRARGRRRRSSQPVRVEVARRHGEPRRTRLRAGARRASRARSRRCPPAGRDGSSHGVGPVGRPGRRARARPPRREPATSRRRVARPRRRWNGDAVVRRLWTRSVGHQLEVVHERAGRDDEHVAVERAAGPPVGQRAPRDAEQRERREDDARRGAGASTTGMVTRDGERGAPHDGAPPGDRRRAAAARAGASARSPCTRTSRSPSASRRTSGIVMAVCCWSPRPGVAALKQVDAHDARARGGAGCRSPERAGGGGAASCAAGGRAGPGSRGGRRRRR